MIENYSSAQKTHTFSSGCHRGVIILSFFLLTLFYGVCNACECGILAPISRQVISQYAVVFKGKVLQVQPCLDGMNSVLVQAETVFYGDFREKYSIEVQCEGTCGMVFNEGEEWLWYCKKNNAQDYLVTTCGHSRKFPVELEQDYEAELRGTSVFEDLEFLGSKYEAIDFDRQDLEGRKYQKVDPDLIPVFLGVSVLFMLVGYLVFKKLRK